MSDDKTLTARDNAALIAEARGWASRKPVPGSADINRNYVLVRLADALDAVTAERDALRNVAKRLSHESLAMEHERDDACAALAEAQQRIEAVKALHRQGPVFARCAGCGSPYPCRTIAALSSSASPATPGCATTPETGIGARQGGVNAVSDPEMGHAAPETETTPETRCYHPSSNPAPGGRTVCRSCGVDTTHDDKMGG